MSLPNSVNIHFPLVSIHSFLFSFHNLQIIPTIQGSQPESFSVLLSILYRHETQGALIFLGLTISNNFISFLIYMLKLNHIFLNFYWKFAFHSYIIY